MKSVKILFVLICFTFMSTGCRHDHSHKEKSSKMEKSNHSRNKDKKSDENHRH